MAAIEFLMFWVPIGFAILVTASYVGTTLALRAYFEGERFQPRDVVRVEGRDESPLATRPTWRRRSRPRRSKRRRRYQ